MRKRHEENQGFTLIELSIVLVIIGLIVGGILVGQSLVEAAAVRSQISQIQRYNVAVRTFQTKYGGYLPGDIPASTATGTFNFAYPPSRTGDKGRGDGNGLIEGYNYSGSIANEGLTSGEGAWFWEDLTANSKLMEGNFNYATDAVYTIPFNPTGYLALSDSLLIPSARIGSQNYIVVYSTGGYNYFSIVANATIDPNGAVRNTGSGTGLSAQQAYNIDKKIDDGYPQTGGVTAQYENWTLQSLPPGVVWAAGGGVAGTSPGGSALGSSTTCYDNGGGTGAMQYSTGQSGGTGLNCALSFKFQ